MKKEHISDALNMLNDDIIEETNNVRTNAKPKRKWVKWGVAAACLCQKHKRPVRLHLLQNICSLLSAAA